MQKISLSSWNAPWNIIIIPPNNKILSSMNKYQTQYSYT